MELSVLSISDSGKFAIAFGMLAAIIAFMFFIVSIMSEKHGRNYSSDIWYRCGYQRRRR